MTIGSVYLTTYLLTTAQNEYCERACSTLAEGGKEQYRPPGKLTLELVLANQKQNKLLCLWTMQLTKWASKVPYLLLLKCSMAK